jgi:predicted phosphodiesterase
LFIGDPHLTCVKPGRRLEEDFLAVGLDKIKQAREIAEDKDLFMVFLGDLLDNPSAKRAGTTRVVENTNAILAGFARAMNFRESVIIPGNHDKSEVRLTPETTLSTMRELRLLHVIEPSGPFGVFEIDGMRVGLGGTPYGEVIPRSVKGAFGEALDRTVWITHDMFVFDERIPGLVDPFEIEGCDLAVNGHDHTTQKPRQIGQTLWFNPGNILRMSVDCADHVPSVWEWTPNGGIHQHALRYNQAAFDLRGLQIEASVKAAHEAEKVREKSLFASLLLSEGSTDMERTGSGDLIAEDIERILSERPISEPAQLTVRNLHRRSPDKMKG